MDAEWGWAPASGTGSALLSREHTPVDVAEMVPAPRTEIRPAVPDLDDRLDVRLYAPTPETVIVWVAGSLDPRSAALLAMRVRQQLHRAPHIVLDLSPVRWIDLGVAGELRTLHATAERCGTQLHIAAENAFVVDALQQIDLGPHVVLGSAAAVLASLARCHS